MERQATVTEKPHRCKNQTRKDGAPDPKRKAKSEKQVPHTARKGRERVRDDSAVLRRRVSLEDRDERDDSAILRQGVSLEDRDSGMTVLVLRIVEQNSEARCGLRPGRA